MEHNLDQTLPFLSHQKASETQKSYLPAKDDFSDWIIVQTEYFASDFPNCNI